MKKLAALALLLCACGSSLPNPWEVKDLRVIGITLDRPEVVPGELVNVSVFADDPDGLGRAVNVEFGFCDNREPGGGSFDCVGGPAYRVLGSGTAVATGVPDVWRYDFQYTVPANVLEGASSVALQYGFNEHIVVRANNGVRVQNATKRVVVRVPLDGQRNVNPVMIDFDVLRDGTLIDPVREGLVRGFEYLLRPVYDVASLQKYSVIDFDQKQIDLEEEASFVWSCSTACALDRRTTFDGDSLLLTAPREASLRDEMNLHVVMRDGRGGEVVIFKRFKLLPQISSRVD